MLLSTGERIAFHHLILATGITQGLLVGVTTK